MDYKKSFFAGLIFVFVASASVFYLPPKAVAANDYILSTKQSSKVSNKVKVKGYYKKNGIYIAPHYRSAPDKSKYNNWSTKGNLNPYTGKNGTRRY